ncbi:sodium/solute symporter [Virgibacillus oceani]
MTIAVFVTYFIAVIFLTFYTSRKLSNKSTDNFSEEFFVGGRNLGPIALAILVAAGVMSTGTFVGTPGLSSQYGPGYIVLFAMGQIPLTLFVLGIFGKKINIVGRRTNSETYIDIFRHRYENWKPLIMILVLAILVALISSAVAEFIGGSRVIQSMTGIPFEYSLIAFGVIITLYTALGGLKGVGVVGILQGFVMTVASLILIVGYISYNNGLTPIFHGLQDIDPKLLTPTYGGAFPLIEMAALWFTYSILLIGLPWGVQSALGYNSTKTMKRAMIIGVVFVGMWTIFISTFGGAAARIFSPDLAVADSAIPTLAQGILPDSLAGLVLAGIAGAGQSTIAALFILASGSIVVNIYKAFVNPQASGNRIKSMSITVTVLIGMLTILLALNPPESLQVILTFSIGGAASSLIAPLILGLFWPRANKYGALAGIVGGLLCYLFLNQIYLGIEVLQQATILFAVPFSFILTALVSLLTTKPSKETIQTFFGEAS